MHAGHRGWGDIDEDEKIKTCVSSAFFKDNGLDMERVCTLVMDGAPSKQENWVVWLHVGSLWHLRWCPRTALCIRWRCAYNGQHDGYNQFHSFHIKPPTLFILQAKKGRKTFEAHTGQQHYGRCLVSEWHIQTPEWSKWRTTRQRQNCYWSPGTDARIPGQTGHLRFLSVLPTEVMAFSRDRFTTASEGGISARGKGGGPYNRWGEIHTRTCWHPVIHNHATGASYEGACTVLEWCQHSSVPQC